MLRWKFAQSQEASLAYSQNTNMSIAEPSHMIHKALQLFRDTQPKNMGSLQTLAQLRAVHPKPSESTELTWDTWIQAAPD